MAEFVQKKLEDITPVLQQIGDLGLFEKSEIVSMTRKLQDHEYKLQRQTKSKEDYLRYIQYGMSVLKLVKQRREKYGVTQKKSDIDFAIANKINHLYKDALARFEDDLRFWIAYIKFCKHVNFDVCISRIMGRMLSVHGDKPKCWHIAARWEVEENKNLRNAKSLLLKGLRFHPNSQLLYTDILKLELDFAFKKNESEVKKESVASTEISNSERETHLQKVFFIYEEALKKVNEINFTVELLNMVELYENTENLQCRIVSDMVKNFPHEPLMWDTMARRELKGLIQPSLSNDENVMDVDVPEQTSMRDRISNCFEVYKTAAEKINTEEMWSLFIDCMLEINLEMDTIPNFKRKLLKTALLQGHQARKLKEKYYLHWIHMLNIDQINQDNAVQKKLYEVLCWATEALPQSENLWQARLHYLLSTNQNNLATEIFNKATKVLGKKALPLWRLRLLHVQTNDPDNLEKFFQDSFKREASISNYMKPIYIEWIILTKDINVARQVYNKLCLQPPPCLELHKKIAALELLQPEICVQNARKPHEIATMQFGEENIDVWMEYITFEMKHGDPVKVSSIYNRAVKTLKSGLAQNFSTEYSLLKTK